MGVDPGCTGGLAVLRPDGAVAFVRGFHGSMTQRQLVDVVKIAAGLLLEYGGRVAFMEKVGVMPTDGRKGANTFGRVDGILRGAVLAFGLDIHDTYPMVWQGALGCLSGGNKNVTKNRAIGLFPGLKITHATADALLIARYGWSRYSL